ncbi:TIGR02285 family protein [bacterium]|nr:TIGR02285 family protein [bacterium]
MKAPLIIIIFMFFSFSSYAKDVITWQVIDWPPFMMLENDSAKGEFGLLLELLQKNLQEYDHINLPMNWSRFWYNVEKGEHYCNIMAFKTSEREKIAEFTIPFTIALSNAIIMEKKTIKRLELEEAKPLSLVKLLKMENVKGILIKTRSYTSPIDNLLKIHENESNITRFPGFKENAILLLLAGRMDYMLEYPGIASHMRKKVTGVPGELVSLQIKEINPISIGHIACPKNDWGKQLVGRINTVIKREKPTPYYRRLIEMSATNKREVQLIRNAYDGFIKATE